MWENIFYKLFYNDLPWITDVYGNKISVQVSIKYIVLYSNIQVTRNVNKSEVLWMCWIGVINYMNASVYFVQKNIITSYVYFPWFFYFSRSIVLNISFYLCGCFINRLEIGVLVCFFAGIFHA